MATFEQIKNVFIALSAFASIDESVHADEPSPGENDGYVERTLTIPARYAGHGEGQVTIVLTVWDDHTPDEYTIEFSDVFSSKLRAVDVAVGDIGRHCRFHGVTQEQHAVLRALLA